MSQEPGSTSLAVCAELACTWEARARKAGNVHPQRSFRDLTVEDFYRSAKAVAPVIARSPDQSVGATVLQAIEATREVVSTNTNLGIVLLLVPLAKVPRPYPLRAGIETVLDMLTIEDSRDVFAAIRLAKPGGMGVRPNQDVRHEPTAPLREIMAMVQDDDLIARQYANAFEEVLDEGLPALERALADCRSLENAIIFCQLTLLARHPDSLIRRKRGYREAKEASERSQAVLAAGWPKSEAGRTAFADFDAWLRAHRNTRNPGTTADLVTASLFAALREGKIPVPCPLPWSHGG